MANRVLYNFTASPHFELRLVEVGGDKTPQLERFFGPGWCTEDEAEEAAWQKVPATAFLYDILRELAALATAAARDRADCETAPWSRSRTFRDRLTGGEWRIEFNESGAPQLFAISADAPPFLTSMTASGAPFVQTLAVEFAALGREQGFAQKIDSLESATHKRVIELEEENDYAFEESRKARARIAEFEERPAGAEAWRLSVPEGCKESLQCAERRFRYGEREWEWMIGLNPPSLDRNKGDGFGWHEIDARDPEAPPLAILAEQFAKLGRDYSAHLPAKARGESARLTEERDRARSCARERGRHIEALEAVLASISALDDDIAERSRRLAGEVGELGARITAVEGCVAGPGCREPTAAQERIAELERQVRALSDQEGERDTEIRRHERAEGVAEGYRVAGFRKADYEAEADRLLARIAELESSSARVVINGDSFLVYSADRIAELEQTELDSRAEVADLLARLEDRTNQVAEWRKKLLAEQEFAGRLATLTAELSGDLTGARGKIRVLQADAAKAAEEMTAALAQFEEQKARADKAEVKAEKWRLDSGRWLVAHDEQKARADGLVKIGVAATEAMNEEWSRAEAAERRVAELESRQAEAFENFAAGCTAGAVAVTKAIMGAEISGGEDEPIEVNRPGPQSFAADVPASALPDDLREALRQAVSDYKVWIPSHAEPSCCRCGFWAAAGEGEMSACAKCSADVAKECGA